MIKKYAYLIGAMAVVVAAIVSVFDINKGLRRELETSRHNVQALMSEVDTYRTGDSLNAATVSALRLTLDEFRRYRSEDAALIKTLQARNGDLQGVIKAQTETIREMYATPKDTVILRDSVAVPAVSVHCGDAWYDFDGVLAAGEFSGTLRNRDSLVVAETVTRGRFLGFLWKTKRIKDRRIDVVSRNPHTVVTGCEHIRIER